MSGLIQLISANLRFYYAYRTQLTTLAQFETSQANDTLLDTGLDVADLADDIANMNTASKIHGGLQGSNLAQVGPKPRLLLMGLKR